MRRLRGIQRKVETVERLLRNLVIFISVMTMLILLLAVSLLQYGVSITIMSSIAISLLSIPIGIAAAFSLRSRGSAGPGLGSVFLLMCGFTLIVSGMAMFSVGQTLQGALYFLLAVSSLRRIPTLRSEAFLQWYSGSFSLPNTGGILNEGEVLASCPSCHSILAVIPSELNIGDTCPNCSGFLVKGTLAQ